MNDRLFKIMESRYKAKLEEAKYKMELLSFFKAGVIIPEHTDVTGEVDTLLGEISAAEDKLAALRRHYGKTEVFAD